MKNKRSMIDTACAVERSLRRLQAASSRIAVGLPGESREDAKSNSQFDCAMISIFLYALIVELTIKGLWSYENCGAEPEHTHHIANIFSKLKHDTQTQIETIYESSCECYTPVLSEGEQRLGKEGIQVEMASLSEALQWNADAMVHFKYDLTPRGKTVPAGAMWGGDTIWTLSADKGQNFGLRLVKWAKGELLQRQAGRLNDTSSSGQPSA